MAKFFTIMTQMWVSWCWTPSLIRRRVRNLEMFLGFDSFGFLISEPGVSYDYILLPQIRHSPNIEDKVPLFISPRKRVAQLVSRWDLSLITSRLGICRKHTSVGVLLLLTVPFSKHDSLGNIYSVTATGRCLAPAQHATIFWIHIRRRNFGSVLNAKIRNIQVYSKCYW